MTDSTLTLALEGYPNSGWSARSFSQVTGLVSCFVANVVWIQFGPVTDDPSSVQPNRIPWILRKPNQLAWLNHDFLALGKQNSSSGYNVICERSYLRQKILITKEKSFLSPTIFWHTWSDRGIIIWTIGMGEAWMIESLIFFTSGNKSKSKQKKVKIS